MSSRRSKSSLFLRPRTLRLSIFKRRLFLLTSNQQYPGFSSISPERWSVKAKDVFFQSKVRPRSKWGGVWLVKHFRKAKLPLWPPTKFALLTWSTTFFGLRRSVARFHRGWFFDTFCKRGSREVMHFARGGTFGNQSLEWFNFDYREDKKASWWSLWYSVSRAVIPALYARLSVGLIEDEQ